MAGALTLVANPGSASRKYALFEGDRERAQLHFEWLYGKVICTLHKDGAQHVVHINVGDLTETAAQVAAILQDKGALAKNEAITCIGLRIVAPSAYFLEDRRIDDDCIAHLTALQQRAHTHITATLQELQALRAQFPQATIAGISDSAFHITKPDYAWNYGISLEDADRFEIKRFGYHGLSVASVVRELQQAGKLPAKLIVCHLGSGASVTAVLGGKSIDNTMGYSPLEGLIMSTRSGSIDPTAVHALKDAFNWSDNAVSEYLSNHSGLLGLGGSSDIRELLRRDHDGDHRSHLALQTYVYNIQKAIGQMASALGGADGLVFTGTVGERSNPIRERIVARLHYLDFILDSKINNTTEAPEAAATISRLAHSKPIYVVPANESAEIARRAQII
ncbi:MAG TPA: hypothetical protein VLI54_03675 [Bacillota bacterium]|nr:hypothetical protein [Bacillota bacterium]